MLKQILIWSLFCIFSLTYSDLSWADGKNIDEKIEQLQSQIDELQTQVYELKQEREKGAVTPQIVSGPKIEIGGQYRVMANSANFGWHPTSISGDEANRSFINQRFRTWFDVTATENVGAYLQLEVGHVGWGSNYEWTKTYAGPSDTGGSDRVGIELRRAFLTYQKEGLGKFKVGIQDWSDSFGDTLASSDWDFNTGGIHYSRQFRDFDLGLGVFKMWEGDNAIEGDDANLAVGDLSYVVDDKSKIGLGTYFLYDGSVYSYPSLTYDTSWDVWTGLNAKTEIGSNAGINGFILTNYGERDDPSWNHFGWAAKLEGSYKPGYGKIGIQGLYASGEKGADADDSDEFRTIAQSERDNFGAQGYWSYLSLTSPRGSSDVADLGVGLQNRGYGLITIQANYEFPIAKRLDGYLAAGWLRSAVDNSTNGENDMGTELVAEASYDLGGGLKLEGGAAYLFTGDFYKAGASSNDPENLYELYSRMQFEF